MLAIITASSCRDVKRKDGVVNCKTGRALGKTALTAASKAEVKLDLEVLTSHPFFLLFIALSKIRYVEDYFKRCFSSLHLCPHRFSTK